MITNKNALTKRKRGLILLGASTNWDIYKSKMSMSIIFKPNYIRVKNESKRDAQQGDNGLLCLLIPSFLWKNGVPLPIASRARFAEVLVNECFSYLRILSLYQILQAFPVRKILLVTIS